MPKAKSRQTAAAQSTPPPKRYHYPREAWVQGAFPAGVTTEPPDRDYLIRHLWDLPLHRLLTELQADGHEVQGVLEEVSLFVWFAQYNTHVYMRQFVNCATGCVLQRQLTGIQLKDQEVIERYRKNEVSRDLKQQLGDLTKKPHKG